MLKLKKPTRIQLKHPKRVIIIVISAIVVLALATYGVLSYLNWKEFEQHSQQGASALKKSIETTLGSKTSTEASSQQIDTIVTNFKTTYGENPCHTTSLYSWQTVLPSLKEMQTQCNERFATALSVIESLKPLSIYLKAEKKTADLFESTLSATEKPTDYTATSATWKAVIDSKDLSTDSHFATVKAKAIEIASAIDSAYVALADATKKEDKAAFDTAVTNLQTAYATLDQLQTTSLEQRGTLTKTFITAYEKL